MKEVKVRWMELSRPELEEAAQNDSIVIVPVASTEQHALHLPVGTDTIIGTEIAERVAKRLVEEDIQSCVTAPIWTGISSHHMDFVGTITLNFESFACIVSQVCSCVFKHGFKRIVLLNSHGGNVAPLEIIASEMKIPVVVVTYLNLVREKMNAMLESTGRHAGELETSLIMSIAPSLVDKTRLSKRKRRTKSWFLREGKVFLYRTHKQRSETGVIGDATLASKEKGDKLWGIIVDELVNFFKEFKSWDLSHLENL